MNKLEVSLLGRFEMNLDGEDVLAALGHSRKKVSLLQYLIVNKNMQFTNYDLFELLWGDEDSTNPESSLKTLVSRLRKDLKPYGLSDIISTSHGVYHWNDAVYDNIDIFKFEDSVNELLNVTELNETTTAKFEDTLVMYKGDLLQSSESETWVVSKGMHYHNLFLRLCYKYIDLLKEEGKYDDMLRISRRGLDLAQYDSGLNLGLMSALLALDMKPEALSHYKYTVNLHYTELGTRPSDEILDFYKTLIAMEHNSEETLETVAMELERDESDATAFVCDYSIFKDIYKINMRNLQRLGIAVFLGVLTLSSTKPNPTDQELLLLDKVMSMLQATLKFNLRKGDTISRYGPSQFVVLLPTPNRNAASAAMERVKDAFYKNCTLPDFVLSYKVTPVGYSSKSDNYKRK